MPDHWHGLIELGENTTLATAMQRFKGIAARAVNQAGSRCGALWAKGFHDRALRHEEGIAATLRYIIANPVRAGLASHPRDYPYWDSICAEDLAWPEGLSGSRD